MKWLLFVCVCFYPGYLTLLWFFFSLSHPKNRDCLKLVKVRKERESPPRSCTPTGTQKQLLNSANKTKATNMLFVTTPLTLMMSGIEFMN